jgi:hypothetical protein
MQFTTQANRTASDRSATVRVSWPGSNFRDITIVQAHPTARIQVTWNRIVDMDLHAIEPNGNLIHAGRTTGTSGYLERDNSPSGRGDPAVETIYIDVPLNGTYQIYLVHHGGGNIPTTSTITVTLGLDRSPQTWTFARESESQNVNLGYNVADVNVVATIVTERHGTRDVVR